MPNCYCNVECTHVNDIEKQRSWFQFDFNGKAFAFKDWTRFHKLIWRDNLDNNDRCLFAGESCSGEAKNRIHREINLPGDVSFIYDGSVVIVADRQ